MNEFLHVVCPDCSAINRVPRGRLGDQPRCAKCKATLFQGRPAPLDTQSFEIHLTRSDLPLIVDFWAPWCGPCHAMAPVFEAAARRLEPRIRFAKVDTDAEPEVASRYGIRSIPTLIAFHGGRELGRQSGAMPLDRLLAWIEGIVR